MSDQWLEELLDARPAFRSGPPGVGTHLNLGCGNDRKPGWVNVDLDARHEPDVCDDSLAYVASLDEGSVDEIYAGHFLEHLTYDEGERFLEGCLRVLKPGGTIGIVVPDTRAIVSRYLRDGLDLDEICAAFLYSTVQDSHHQWSYDLHTLGRALTRSGFELGAEIDRFDDPRLAAGAWWQCGIDGIKPSTRSTRRRRFLRRRA